MTTGRWNIGSINIPETPFNLIKSNTPARAYGDVGITALGGNVNRRAQTSSGGLDWGGQTPINFDLPEMTIGSNNSVLGTKVSNVFANQPTNTEQSGSDILNEETPEAPSRGARLEGRRSSGGAFLRLAGRSGR